MKQSPKPGLEEIVARVENEEETENKPINRQSIRELWLSRLRLFLLYKVHGRIPENNLFCQK